MSVPLWAWLAFAGFVVTALTVDLLAHRRPHAVRLREAAAWSTLWVGLALVFALVLLLTLGGQAAGQFTSAWLVEKSLSVDNLFVFALLFTWFRVPAAYQHRVLFLGVVGALVMRLVLLAAGVALLDAVHVVVYVFGAFLVWTAVKLAKDDGEVSIDPGSSRAVRLLRRVMPVTDDYEGQRMLTRVGGRRAATPLLAVLVAVEAADLVFAVDSIPAVLSISDNTFVVFTSNAFAILGLRALYFLLAGAMGRFHHLGKGLAVVLGFIGVKMLLSDLVHIPTGVALGVIAAVLGTAVVASLRTSPPQPAVGVDADDPAGPSTPAVTAVAGR